MNKKNITIILLSFAIGALVGIIGSILTISKITANAMIVLALQERNGFGVKP